MEKLDEQFFLNPRSNEIWSRTVWCRRYIKDLTESEVESIILDEDPEVFVNAERDILSPVPKNDLPAFWSTQLKDHIAGPDSDLELSEFSNGYCYYAELWKAKGGQPVLVLKYNH